MIRPATHRSRPRAAALSMLSATLGLAGALGLAGCGSSHAAPQSAAQRAGARALSASQAALDKVNSVRVTTELHTASGSSSRSVSDIVVGHRMQVTLTRGTESSQLRLIGGYVYLRANSAYWQASGTSAGAASLLAPHWYKLSANQLSDATSLLAVMMPATLGQCTLGLPASTTTVTGHGSATTRLTQRSADTTDQITIANGSSRPLAEHRDGPGGASTTCGGSSTTERVTSGTTTFSRYGTPVTVTAPAHTLDQDQLTRLQSAIGRRSTTTN